MRDVFISHSSKDFEAASEICEALERNRLTCFMPPRNMPASRGVRECAVVVLVFSENADVSQSVFGEVQQAFGENKIIVPVRFNDAEISDDLNFFLDGAEWVNISNDDFSALLSRVKQEIGLVNNKNVWQPVEFNEKAINTKNAVVGAAVLISVILAISVVFFFASGGMDSFEQYVSVYIEIEDTRFVINVNRDAAVIEISNLDQNGLILLDGLNYDRIPLRFVIQELAERAFYRGLLFDFRNVFKSIHAPRGVDQAWVEFVEAELNHVRFVVN